VCLKRGPLAGDEVGIDAELTRPAFGVFRTKKSNGRVGNDPNRGTRCTTLTSPKPRCCRPSNKRRRCGQGAAVLVINNDTGSVLGKGEDLSFQKSIDRIYRAV
jgi:hypothetical protein